MGTEKLILSVQDYRAKTLGCWMGKNIGGTLGAPFEWKRQLNDVSFYTQDLKGEPLPNDDLDLQLAWLIALEEQGIDIDAGKLAAFWLHYVTPHWAEYGNAKANLRSGLMPPLSGMVNNPFKDSCGAFIRSEIWACLAPGAPSVAVRYAREDASVDHGDGEGTLAAVFCAAVQSAAFIESDFSKLVEIGLSYIPEDCGIARAIRTAMECYREGKSWQEARDELLRRHRGHYMTYAGISQRDRDMGFADGPPGYDAPVNVAIVVLAWLYGEGDFDRSICLAVNCGEDTDCTAATLGALWGIIHGIDAIPGRWIEPIGRGIKTISLNEGDLQGLIPQTIDELTDRIERLARQVTLRHCPFLEWTETGTTAVPKAALERLKASPADLAELAAPSGPVYRSSMAEARVVYENGPYASDGAEAAIVLCLRNSTRIQHTYRIRWYAPEGWTVGPAESGAIFLGLGQEKKIAFRLSAEKVADGAARFAVEVTADGTHDVLLVPVILLNGNLAGG